MQNGSGVLGTAAIDDNMTKNKQQDRPNLKLGKRTKEQQLATAAASRHNSGDQLSPAHASESFHEEQDHHESNSNSRNKRRR